MMEGHIIGRWDVPYTLWSRGRQLGETDLGFVFRYNGQDAEIEAFEKWNAEDVPEVQLSPAKESDFPRYQIQVYLVNRDSVP